MQAQIYQQVYCLCLGHTQIWTLKELIGIGQSLGPILPDYTEKLVRSTFGMPPVPVPLVVHHILY